MGQLNIHMTPAFEQALARFMRLRGFRTKSEAVRAAVQEGLQHVLSGQRTCDYVEWLGTGRAAPLNPEPRFRSEDELWE